MPDAAYREIAPGAVVSRVIRGGWQLAGGHGTIDRAAAVDDLVAAFDAGITTFDCADIYTGVEDLYGVFRQRLFAERGREALGQLRIHTKLVPDLARLGDVSKEMIEGIVAQSAKRLRMERLDLVQFHWWDYGVPRYLDTLHWLDDLRRDGRVAMIGGTNFDTQRASEIVMAGIPLSSLQVQYSVLDHRPEALLVPFAARHAIALFCYGSVAGGFLGERWLGAAEPAASLENRSLVKYRLMIDEFGGWDLFQALLATLRRVGQRHGVDIATVASRHVLDRPGVSSVIVGARNRAHLAANAKIVALALTQEDRSDIAAILSQRRGPRGDVYDLERDRDGPHGSIMKYNLNAKAPQAKTTDRPDPAKGLADMAENDGVER